MQVGKCFNFPFFFQIDRKKGGLVNKVTEFALGFDFIKDKVFGKAKQQVMKLSGGLYPAPLKVRIFFRTKLKS